MGKQVKSMVMTNGKGDKPRPLNRKKFEKNYDRIFNEQKSNPTDKEQTKKKKTNQKTFSKQMGHGKKLEQVLQW